MNKKQYQQRQERYWLAKNAGYTAKEAMKLRSHTLEVVEEMVKYKTSEKVIFEEALNNAIEKKGRKRK